MLKGATFDNQNVTSKLDGGLYRAILTDGIIWGCSMSVTESSLTIQPGELLASGRVVYIDGATTLDVDTTMAGYAQLVLTIDLSQTSDESVFEQAAFGWVYSTTTTFPALVQEDINDTGTMYQLQIAVVQISGGNVTGITSVSGPAGIVGLTNYLPLSGGTLAGPLSVSGQLAAASIKVNGGNVSLDETKGVYSGGYALIQRNTLGSINIGYPDTPGMGDARVFVAANGNLYVDRGGTMYVAYDAGNISDVLEDYLPLSGGTLTGNLTMKNSNILLDATQAIYSGGSILLRRNADGNINIGYPDTPGMKDVRAYVAADGNFCVNRGGTTYVAYDAGNISDVLEDYLPLTGGDLTGALSVPIGKSFYAGNTRLIGKSENGSIVIGFPGETPLNDVRLCVAANQNAYVYRGNSVNTIFDSGNMPGLEVKQLWNGSWSTGTVNIGSMLADYTAFLIVPSDFAVAIPAFKYGSVLRGMGGTAGTVATEYYFNGTISSTSITLTNFSKMTHNSGAAHGALTEAGVREIWGLR